MADAMTGVSTPAQVARAFDVLRFVPPADGTPDTMLADARAFMDNYGQADIARWIRGCTVKPVSASGVSADYVVPDGCDEARRIVLLHGGGWVAGSAKSHRALAGALATATGCAILVVDYRLAPEHAYPAGLDDCLAAFRWCAENGPSGVSPADRIYLAGDSAGGNLVVATAMRLADAGGRGADALVCLSAMLDIMPSDYQAKHDEICTPEAMAGSSAMYLQGQALDADRHLSCVNAALADLEKLPPTLLQVSSDEYFLDCNRRFAEKLSEARVRTILSVWPRMPHVWHQCLDIVPEAAGAIREIASFLEAAGRRQPTI